MACLQAGHADHEILLNALTSLKASQPKPILYYMGVRCPTVTVASMAVAW